MSRVPLLPDRERPLIFAHRGCSSLAPENTFAAFRKARETGAPGIELDIHATADGRLAVAHDDTFTRTAPPDNNGGGRPLEELSYAEIRGIDAGSFFGPGFSHEHPPLLEEVLEEFCPGMYVDIELKSRKTRDDPLPPLLAEKLKALPPRISGAVTVSSFNPLCLLAFKKAWRSSGVQARRTQADGGFRGDIPTAVIYCAGREVPPLLRRGFGRIIAGCDYLKPIHSQVNGFTRFRAGLEKRPLVPWTVDDRALGEKLLRSGCQGFITNRPQDWFPQAEKRPPESRLPQAESLAAPR
ncbi:MAG: glycerophosphodiester phosphodiesterase [Treponema sp.]|jgi:glycerophosphoryl diester phosphodiesterase|nr:glycerophosphodiester phosphodiesterase [Treponema sp.]